MDALKTLAMMLCSNINSHTEQIELLIVEIIY